MWHTFFKIKKLDTSSRRHHVVTLGLHKYIMYYDKIEIRVFFSGNKIELILIQIIIGYFGITRLENSSKNKPLNG